MSKKSKRESARIRQIHIESESDRLVTMVMNAIAADLGSGGDRILGLNAVRALRISSRKKEKNLFVLKMAAKSALKEVGKFFAGLGISLPEVVEALMKKRELDQSVVDKIQKAAAAWDSLGRIGD